MAAYLGAPLSATATTRALVGYMQHTHHAGATVGSLTVVGATVSCPSHRVALPPIVHECYGDLAPPCERLCMGTPVNKIKYNCKNISNIY